MLVWHRRAGKDKCSINILTMLAMRDVGNYLYMAPEITQARKIIWQGIDREGQRFIDHIPRGLITRKTESDMLVELINGSTIQLGGADNYDRQMGTNPKAIVFSEFSLMNPMAWNYFRPILVENQGVAIFIYTPRGHNHGHDMYKVACERVAAGDPNWYVSHLTVDDTRRPDGSPVITQTDIDAEIEEGMPPEMVRQEFYCSFEAGMMGAYYADLMGKAHAQDRVGHFPHDPRHPVITAWDLGLADMNSIIYMQDIQGQYRIIDYAEDSGVPMSSWIKEVNSKPYNYAYHIGPHDLEQREYTTGKTRLETANELGLDFEVVPRMPVMEGINAVREMLPLCTFNEDSTYELIDALSNYTKVYDEKAQTFRERPLHNKASHGADAFRQLALGKTDQSALFEGKPRFAVKTATHNFKAARQ